MRFRLRFSLHTLLLASLLAGGAMLLWRVREPWTLKVWPLVKTPFVSPVSLPPCNAAISHSGKYLFVSPGEYYLQCIQGENIPVVLDLQMNKIIATYPQGNLLEWHWEHNWLLVVDPGKTARVIEFPSQKVLFEIAEGHQAVYYFAANGKLLIEFPFPATVGTIKSFHVYATDSWRRILQGPSPTFQTGLSFSADGSIYVLPSLCPTDNAAEASERCVECHDLRTDAIRWKWNIPHEAGVVWTTEFSDNGEKIKIICVPEPRSSPTYFTYMLDTATGRLIEREESNTATVVLSGAVSRPQAMTRDKTWRVVLYPFGIAILAQPSDNQIGATLLGSSEQAIIGAPLLVSDNKQIISAHVNKSVGIWTRTRQHFEWWGLYERPETWAALFLFLALLRSLVRDYRPRVSS